MSPPRAPHHALHLASADFDAYLPERATSNAFTRPRLELKQRMLAWAKGVVARLAQPHLAVSVEVAASDEHPSLRNGRRVDFQRVLFWRDAAARAEIEKLIDRKKSLSAAIGDPAPYQKHAFLALRIDAKGLEVGVELNPDAWVDTRNLRMRLTDATRTLELIGALEALPEQFAIGVGSAAGAEPASKATSDTVRALLDRAEGEGKRLWVGWSVPRDVAVTHSAVLDDQLEDATLALGPIYKLFAWSPDNDLIVLGREVEAAKQESARAHEEAERERTEWEARRERERDRARTHERERISEATLTSTPANGASGAKKKRDGDPQSQPHGQSQPQAHPQPDAAADVPRLARREKRPQIAKPANRAVARRSPRVTEVDPSAPIEKGTRVQVLAGPFVGKVGVVHELDGKGAARVMLGLLAARLDVKDLIASAEGKDRPALATSHRKPIPARS